MLAIEFKPLLTSAVAEVLESMYFVSVLGPTSMSEEPDESWLCIRLEFSGAAKGYLGIGTSAVTGRILASNFLGQEAEETSATQIEEVLCELSNMICGSFLSRYRSGHLFDLSHPLRQSHVRQSQALPTSTMTAQAAIQTLELDEGVICIWLEFES